MLKFNKRLEDMEYKAVFVATKIKYICHKILDKKLQEHYQKKQWTTINNICKAVSGKLSFKIDSKIVNQNEYELQHYLKLSLLKKMWQICPNKPKNSAHS